MEVGHNCSDCTFQTFDGEFGEIQSCVKNEVTFTDDNMIEINDIIYKFGQCPLYKRLDISVLPEIPF